MKAQASLDITYGVFFETVFAVWVGGKESWAIIPGVCKKFLKKKNNKAKHLSYLFFTATKLISPETFEHNNN